METVENKEFQQEEPDVSKEEKNKEFSQEEPNVSKETDGNEDVFEVEIVSEEESQPLAVEESEDDEKEMEEDKISSISDSVQELLNKVDKMNELFEKKIAHTTHEEKIVDQMHAELQKYKQDMYAQLVKPILLDIIGIRDSILRLSANFATKPEGEQNVPLKMFSDYAFFDIQDILEKNNIVIYSSQGGESFIPIKQKVIKKVFTEDEELHGKIAESLSCGYDYLGKTISPEKVAVYVYQKNEDVEGEKNNG